MWQKGLGFHAMWGFSPAKNLLDHCAKGVCHHRDGPICILLLQPCDPRHIVRSVAELCLLEEDGDEMSGREIHFYIVEPRPEVLARHLLLLHIFFDCQIPIRHRAALYLEVFGNALVQERTEVYIEAAGRALSSEHGGCHWSHMLDWSHLKQRERDDVETVFSSWRRTVDFDVATFREHRLRAFYGQRYDCRSNVVDWDYHSTVKKVASIIHTKQYRQWRLSGVAFEFGNVLYNKPNRTTASFVEGTTKNGNGTKKDMKGYWLDIVVGPYVAFGVECDRNDEYSRTLFDVLNKGTGAEQHRHHSVSVSLYNVISFMWAIETGEVYKVKHKHDMFSGLGEEEPANAKDENDKSCEIPKGRKPQVLARLKNNLKIIPLGADFTCQGMKKKRYHGCFDHVSFSQQMAHVMNMDQFSNILKVNATVSVETTKFVVPFCSDTQQEAIKDMVFEMAEKHGLVPEITLSRKRKEDNLEHNTKNDTDMYWFQRGK